MSLGYPTSHLPAATHYPQQNHSVTTSPPSRAGRNTSANSPELTSFDGLTTEQKIPTLKSHLITVLCHFLTIEGFEYVIHGGMAMAIHLNEIWTSHAATEKDYHGIDQLSEEAESLFPLSCDKLNDIDLSTNSQQPDINRMCNYLKQSIDKEKIHESLIFTVTKSLPINKIFRVETPNEKRKTDYAFKIIGRTQTIVIEFEKKIILSIDINYAPEQVEDKPPFQHHKPYINRYTLKTIILGNNFYEIKLCIIDQLISNLQNAFTNTAGNINIKNNKFLNKLKLLEQLIGHNLLDHKERDLTSNCWQQVMNFLQHNTFTRDQEVQTSTELKEQGTDTFKQTPTLTDKSINTITTDLRDRASNTDNEHLQQVHREVQTSYPETKDTCVNTVTATFLTVDTTTDNTPGPDSNDHVSPVNSAPKKGRRSRNKRDSQQSIRTPADGSENIAKVAGRDPLAVQHSHQHKKQTRDSVALAGAPSPEVKTTTNTLRAADSKNKKDKANDPIPPKVKDKTTNTPHPPVSKDKKDKANDPIPPGVKSRHTQTEKILATPCLDRSADEVFDQDSGNQLDFSVSLPATEPPGSDDENNPIPIDIRLPYYIQEPPEITIVAHSIGCQTEILPSVTDNDNKEIISPAQKIKVPTPEELMTQFKEKLINLVSSIDSNDQPESIVFYEKKTTELIDIYELFITLETTWVSIANSKDLRIISDNLLKISTQIKKIINNTNAHNNDNSLIKLISTAPCFILINFQTRTANNILLPNQAEASIYTDYLTSVKELCCLIQEIVDTSTSKEKQSLKKSNQLAKYLEINYKIIAETFLEKSSKIDIDPTRTLAIILSILSNITDNRAFDFPLYNIAILHTLYLKRTTNGYLRYLPLFGQLLFNRLFADTMFTLIYNPACRAFLNTQSQTTTISPANFLRMPKLYTWLASIGKYVLAAITLQKYLELINNEEASEHFEQAIEAGFTAIPNRKIIHHIYHSLTLDAPADHRVEAHTRGPSIKITKLQLKLYDDIQKCYRLLKSRKEVHIALLNIDDPQRKERLQFWENAETTPREENSRWCTVL